MNNEEQPSGNPWMKNLMIWGGIFLALLLVVSMFNTKAEAPGTQVGYSDFRAQVANGKVEKVQVSETKITGKFKDGKTFTTVPIPNDTSLPQLLQENGVQYEGKTPEEPSLIAAILFQTLPFLLLIGLMIFAMRQFQKGGGAGGAMGFGKSKAKMLTEKQGRVTFDDVAGIDDTFVVANGDVLTDVDVSALVEFHRARGAEGTLHLTPVPDPSAFGVVAVDAAGNVSVASGEVTATTPAPDTSPPTAPTGLTTASIPSPGRTAGGGGTVRASATAAPPGSGCGRRRPR